MFSILIGVYLLVSETKTEKKKSLIEGSVGALGIS